MKSLVFALSILAFFFSPAGPPYKPTLLRNDHVVRSGGHQETRENTPTDRVWIDAWDMTITPNTWQIPNCIGHGFSLEVEFSNVPKDFTHADLEVTFPPMELPNGQIKSRIARKQELDRYDDKAWFSYTYFFDEPYECGLGEWVIRLSTGDKELYRATFEIVNCPDKEGE